MQVDEQLYLLGIRHHGPGSAASVLNALEQLKPDLILLEGAPEADAIIEFAAHHDMRPPVAQLIYAVDEPADSVFYPFTEFSPEWQSIRFALTHQNTTTLRFFDLPQSHSLALARQQREQLARQSEQDNDDDDDDDDDNETNEPISHLWQRRDPLDYLAEAAGFNDGERWWEYVVEQRRHTQDTDLSVFAAIAEAMTETRQHIENDIPISHRETLREAWMRKTIRQARKEFQRIVVVCGAWHVPALARKVAAKDDNALLKGLARIKVNTTWVPWTHSRISYASGYGAGINAPGWYRHLWQHRQHGEQRARKITSSWLVKVARLLRDEGLDVAAANVIEGVRFAETLAALREQPIAGLAELNEAALTTFCFGDETPLQLIQQQLIVGEELGSVPDDTPIVPLAQDLQQQQKRLRLQPQAVEKTLQLDLRQPLALERSCLLQRLNLLDIPWGRLHERNSSKGTFKEIWQLQWQPEFAIKLIEAAIWGNTISSATDQACRERLRNTQSLAEISNTLDALLLADLPATVAFAVQRLEHEAAIASDVVQLMAALPGLARVMRYSDVRNTDADLLAHVIDGFCARICTGLAAACSSLDEEAAEFVLKHIVAAHDAFNLLQHAAWSEQWLNTLSKLAGQDNLHGLIAGRCYRLLLAADIIDHEEAARRLQFALSSAVEPGHAAAWLEGMLAGSGTLLIHDQQLWQIIDRWLTQLDSGHFIELLPLLRRTFGSFEFALRRQLLEKARSGEHSSPAQSSVDKSLDITKAEASLALTRQLLGLS